MVMIMIKIIMIIMMAKNTGQNGKIQYLFEMENCPAGITVDKNHIFKLPYKHHNAIYNRKHKNEYIQIAELTCLGSSEPIGLARTFPSI